MPICGYSIKMKLGLEGFADGVFDAIVKKSPTNEIIPSQIALEQDQLATMILEGDRIKTHITNLDLVRKIEALNAIAYIVRYFIGDEVVRNSSKLTQEHLKAKAIELAEMIESFDSYFDFENKEQSNITRQRIAWEKLVS
jgi:hypothetical protein